MIKLITFLIYLVSSVFIAFAEDELPLDAWIIKKKPVQEVSDKDKISDEESKIQDELAEKEAKRQELIEEERDIYKALIEDYDDSKTEETEKKIPSASKIFKKSVLTRLENKRIDKAKVIQSQVRQEQIQKVKKLTKSEKIRPQEVRLCLISFSSMGFPSDLSRVFKNPPSSTSTIWQRFNKQVPLLACDFVALNGLVAKTKTRGIEFMEKTISQISKIDKRNWSYVISQSEGMGFFAFMYDVNVFHVKEQEEVQSVILRRGGIFKEEHFISAPIEILLEDARVAIPNSLRLFIFDFRNFRKLSSNPETSHIMQMTQALNELSRKRTKFFPDEFVFLFGSLLENRNSPSYEILSGRLMLEDFLNDGSCKFVSNLDGEEEDEEDDIVEDRIYKCNKDRLEKKPQEIFSILEELSQKIKIPNKSTSHIKKDLAKIPLTSDIFIHSSSVSIKKPETKGEEMPSGFINIGVEDQQAIFIWLDVISEKLE